MVACLVGAAGLLHDHTLALVVLLATAAAGAVVIAWDVLRRPPKRPAGTLRVLTPPSIRVPRSTSAPRTFADRMRPRRKPNCADCGSKNGEPVNRTAGRSGYVMASYSPSGSPPRSRSMVRSAPIIPRAPAPALFVASLFVLGYGLAGAIAIMAGRADFKLIDTAVLSAKSLPIERYLADASAKHRMAHWQEVARQWASPRRSCIDSRRRSSTSSRSPRASSLARRADCSLRGGSTEIRCRSIAQEPAVGRA
jgi:hypothetical protein